ncbi:hypothetical protein B0H14DRAFT_3491492 [Mycena olivaceomarginata]|nr:hypothetical protein B0H14DRAFT_3491492 [Mycena olivaceomarginata]
MDCQPAVSALASPKPPPGQYLLHAFHSGLCRLLHACLSTRSPRTLASRATRPLTPCAQEAAPPLCVLPLKSSRTADPPKGHRYQRLRGLRLLRCPRAHQIRPLLMNRRYNNMCSYP